MTAVEDVLTNSFRDTLPDAHNKEMWVNETLLEYKRLRLLRSQGFSLIPEDGSLMDRLLQLDPDPFNFENARDGHGAYLKCFGHAPTYCWTVKVTDLYLKLASSSSAPGTAWMGENA